MEFVLPSHQEDVAIDYLPSPHRDPALITYIPAKVTSGPFGAILHQEEEGTHSGYFRDHIRLDEPKTLYYIIAEPTVLISYVIKGNPTCLVKPRTLPENTYHLYYLPAGQHGLSLAVGEYTLCHFALSLKMLSDMQQDCAEIDAVTKHLVTTATEGVRQVSLPVNRHVYNVFERLRKNNLTGWVRKVEVEKQICELMKEYAGAVKKTDKHFKSKYRTGAVDSQVLSEITLSLTRVGNPQGAVKKMSKKAGVGYRHACDEFRVKTGITLKDARPLAKIDKARELLLTTRLRVKEIALDVGYANPSIFTATFKKVTGYKPLEYRKINRGPHEPRS
ncbi:helix-turn-helix transcriptional regulator [uncultured Chitinophaga sp.]|uniref:helix-turn-helix domain-containing protein n=1 Tax=uncultured Chitinophaga sp. TaxID=339340 RepID=UPI0025E63F94|nr:helix-turn-helix transcriptional regulator [uncultured Chitinophaga sp.]